jgi:pimeloyl-ACP methyl ester carboxylesterase
MEFESFQAAIPESALADLQRRLANVRWPKLDWTYGVPSSYVRRLAERWRSGYDWRAWEARLNAYPQFVTTIDGQRIHFMHVRSRRRKSLPLVLTHGWPGSVFEFIRVIDPLSGLDAGNAGEDLAFDLVIPSLPGFGFSGMTSQPGWTADRIAKAWIQLMQGLGYERYGVVGNDWGSVISPQMARFAPGSIVGTHVTQVFLDPADDLSDLPNPTPKELQAIEGLNWYREHMSAYHALQAQQPQTLAYSLADSPLGLLAWFCQIFRDGEGIDDDFVLTNASLYWLTNTIASSARIYYEDGHAPLASDPSDTPMAVAMFRDDGKSFRRLADRLYTNIVQWSEFDQGGHYAAYQVPDLWIADVRKFFSGLNRSQTIR